MKIGINIESLYPGKIGGAEQYVRNVIHEMGKKPDVELAVFINKDASMTFSEEEKIKLYVLNAEESIHTQLNYYIDMLNIDIIFCPLFHLAPINCLIPAVVSVLDIQQDYFPEYFSKKVLKDRRELTKDTFKNADGIITISEFSKSTIIEKYGIHTEKLCVTHLNADGVFDNPIDQKTLTEVKKSIGTDYIFYPANSWPHKNHMRLLKAYKILKDQYKTKLKLVFSGDGKQKKEDIDEFIKDNKLENDILYLGYRRQEEMPYVFANAKILVFPSLFEGFGIPLVEAMKAKVPIACSNTTSLPEVAKDCAVMFNPLDEADIAMKLHELEVNQKLCDELVEKGAIRAKDFSWEKCADQTISFLKKVYNQKATKDVKYEHDEMPLVSIITPSYNQGPFIRETIESVLNQDYPNIEYIVMDGGSTDETVEILKSYGSRINWKSEKDDGQADAVNKGIGIAKGSIIGWLNSDDTYLPGAVSRIVEYLKSHPNTDLVYGEGYYIDKESNVTERYLTEKFDKSRLAEQCIICQPTAFFTKKIIEEAQYLNKDLQLCMDYELWIRIAQIGKISYIPDYIATSRMYEENKTLSRRQEVYSEICNVIKKYYGYVPVSWIYGFADYLNDGRRDKKFECDKRNLFLKYNKTNPKFIGRIAWESYKRKHGKKDDFTEQYCDGWVPKVCYLKKNLFGQIRRIQITGMHAWPMEEDLVIQVRLNNKKLGSIVVSDKGDFIRQLEFPSVTGKVNSLVELKVNNTFNPKALKINSDARDLAFLLKNIEFLED